MKSGQALQLLSLTLSLLSGSILSLSLSLDGVLRQHISAHELLRYETLSQHRNVRSTGEHPISWLFEAYGRQFNIKLSRDVTTVSEDAVVEHEGQLYPHDVNLFTGNLEGDPGSLVSGLILPDGSFEGQLITSEHTYYFESYSKLRRSHLNDPSTVGPPLYDSVMYRLADIRNHVDSTMCRSSESSPLLRKIQTEMTYKDRHTRVQKPFNEEPVTNIRHENENGRKRRSTVDANKLVCELYVQADHLFANNYNNMEVTIEAMSSFVSAVNDIYMGTDFDEDGTPDNIRFVIKRSKVWSENDPDYPYSKNYGVESFLKKFSQTENLDNFCLGVMFTHRDFEGGTLGLAWTGSTSAVGGVCQDNIKYRGVDTSLNSNVVTTLNYGLNVFLSTSIHTLAHELGHNFGSPHDSGPGVCAPGEPNGNFIMYPSAPNGDASNSDKFSVCSRQIINAVLEVKARTAVTGCFVEYTGSICGNSVVESGEECDCGWDGECQESCCNPQADTPTATPCTLVTPNTCSPSQGPCCTSNCSLATAGVCQSATGCMSNSSCDGSNYTCPEPGPEPNGTACSITGDLVCGNGVCSLHVCDFLGMTHCMCSPAEAGDIKDPDLCMMCCMNGGQCTLAVDIPAINQTIKMSPGQPCFNYEGFCDVFSICREYDPEGTLSQLKNLFFSEEGINAIKDWLVNNWWIPVVGFVAFVLLMGLFVRFCGVRHPNTGSIVKVSPSPG